MSSIDKKRSVFHFPWQDLHAARHTPIFQCLQCFSLHILQWNPRNRFAGWINKEDEQISGKKMNKAIEKVLEKLSFFRNFSFKKTLEKNLSQRSFLSSLRNNRAYRISPLTVVGFAGIRMVNYLFQFFNQIFALFAKC